MFNFIMNYFFLQQMSNILKFENVTHMNCIYFRPEDIHWVQFINTRSK